jgi:diguanylate cyclase (GGDEF)-like protein
VVVRKLSLVNVLSEFAETMGTDFAIGPVLERLVQQIVELSPVCAAGVALVSDDKKPYHTVISNPLALRFATLQTELGEGPSFESCLTGKAISVTDLRDEDRFPRFASRARSGGLEAAFSFPLLHGITTFGALDLYLDAPGGLDPDETATAQTLAHVVAAYLISAGATAHLMDDSARPPQVPLRDGLTGLANRTLFLEHLEHAARRSRASESLLAVIFAELDGLAAAKSIYGDWIGDELVLLAIERIGEVLRPDDTIGRTVASRFVVLCEDLRGPSEAATIAARIRRQLDQPFTVAALGIQLNAGVTVAFSGRSDQLPRHLASAGSALNRAIGSDGGQPGLDRPLRHLAHRRARLTHDLARALSRDEFRTVYQPIIADDERVLGVEALLRWVHPSRGAVPPAAFIPLAEQSGIINEIGRWVLTRACCDRSDWQLKGIPGVMPVYVNVSPHQLMSPDFVGTVAAILEDTSTEPQAVTLELTEGAFVHDSEHALTVLRALKALGVSLALDDFGTGYSSLSYLNRLPIDVVKIDRAFVANLTTDVATRSIVAAIVDLCHTLGMTVIGEGVETAEQHAQLAALGCDSYQGFHFARPMPVANLTSAIHVSGQGPQLRSLSLTTSGEALAG